MHKDTRLSKSRSRFSFSNTSEGSCLLSISPFEMNDTGEYSNQYHGEENEISPVYHLVVTGTCVTFHLMLGTNFDVGNHFDVRNQRRIWKVMVSIVSLEFQDLVSFFTVAL